MKSCRGDTRLRLKSYEKMKDSGVELIGKIPEQWKTKKIKFVCEINPSKNEVNNLSKDLDISFLPMEKIGADGKLKLEEKRKLNEVVNGFTYFRNDDVIIAKITPCFENGKGSLCEGLENNIGFGSTELHVLRSKNEFDPIFTYWWTRSNQFLQNGEASMYGAAGQKRIPIEFIKNFEISYPESILEQRKIGKFLKKHIERTDEEIGKNKKTIFLLKEKQQSIINQSVTQGLNPSVKMKDSGIEWIEKIPEHWKIDKLHLLTEKIGDGIHSTPNYVDESEYFFINGNNLINGKITFFDNTKNISELEYKKFKLDLTKKTVFLSINGTIGNVALFKNEKIILGKSACYINCNDNLDQGFLFYLLKSFYIKTYFELELTGTTIYNLSLESIRKSPISLPPIDEQKKIVDYLKKNILEIEKIILKSQIQIRKLHEFRESLISSVLTGKINVTSLAK